MPDLLTHLMVAEGCRTVLPSAKLTPWFLIGTVLPDILTRPFIIATGSLSVFWFVMPLHTPLGLLVVCAFIACCFPSKNYRRIFCHLLAGAALHLVLDICQQHFGGGYYLLFPFSWSSFEIQLVWPETSLYLLPLWVVIGVFITIRWFLSAGTPTPTIR